MALGQDFRRGHRLRFPGHHVRRFLHTQTLAFGCPLSQLSGTKNGDQLAPHSLAVVVIPGEWRGDGIFDLLASRASTLWATQAASCWAAFLRGSWLSGKKVPFQADACWHTLRHVWYHTSHMEVTSS